MSIKLLIADDQEVVRLGLKEFVSGTEIEIVAEADNVEDTVGKAGSSQPDVAVMAVRIGGESGFSVLERIRNELSQLPVIMTADDTHPAYLAQAHSSGAAGFLEKGFSRDELVGAVRAVAAGETFWTRTDVRRVTGVLSTPRLNVDAGAPLTLREVDVLSGITKGHTNRQIAEALGISYETVKEHVQHVLRKLGVGDRTQAAVWAVRNGLVEFPAPEDA